MQAFYELNRKFEANLRKIYEHDRSLAISGKDKILPKYIKLFKEDKVLKAQYDLYSTLNEGVSKAIKEDRELSREYINELLKPFEKFSTKQIQEANKKFLNLIEKAHITWDENDNINKPDPLFESVNYVIEHGRKDMEKYLENKSTIINGLKIKNKTPKIVDTDDAIRDFNKKYSGKLTNEEMEIVSSLATGNYEKPLLSYQKSLVNDINHVIKENNEDVELKSKLLQLKEKVMFEECSDFDKFTSLYEIRKVVNEIQGDDDNVDNIPENISFDNWVYPDTKDLELEYRIEYVGHYADPYETYKTSEEFVDAVNNSPTERITESMDDTIGYRSHTQNYNQLLSLISSYRSYPEFRNENTLQAIYDGFKNNSPMKMPIITKFPNGKLRIMSGNTRADIAIQLLGYYEAIILELGNQPKEPKDNQELENDI
jgi:hypothetical protein